jgi:hypothetical protein
MYVKTVRNKITKPRLLRPIIKYEWQTEAYLDILGVHLSLADRIALNANIRAIKTTPGGITLSSVTFYRSDVNGTAFITQPSVDLRAYLDFRLTFADGAIGWVKAAGTGETYGENFFVNPTFTSDEPPGTAWVKSPEATITGGKGVVSKLAGAAAIFSQASTGAAGKLFKGQFTTDSITGGAAYMIIGSVQQANQASAGTFTYYVTATGNVNSITASSLCTALQIDNASRIQVLTPSDNGGITVVNEQGGATYNWATVGTTPNTTTQNITITRT